MTDTTMNLRPGLRPAQRLRGWLTSRSRRRAPAANLDTLSDHMLRDIGIERDALAKMAVRTLHSALCHPG